MGKKKPTYPDTMDKKDSPKEHMDKYRHLIENDMDYKEFMCFKFDNFNKVKGVSEDA